MNKNKYLGELAHNTVKFLNVSGYQLALAESCSGGLIAKLLTDIPGCSSCFGYGVISYSDQAKMSLLGVKKLTLEKHGAVSSETVKEMALGILLKSNANIAVSISGIAGPEGGTFTKPIGTVWVGWARYFKGQQCIETEKKLFSGDRNNIRLQVAEYVFDGIIQRLSGEH